MSTFEQTKQKYRDRLQEYLDEYTFELSRPMSWQERACVSRYLKDIKRVKEDETFPWVLNWDVATNAMLTFEAFPYIKGEKARLGKKFDDLAPWQVFCEVQLFGWVHRDDPKLRRFSSSGEYVPRKNGKSFRAAARAVTFLTTFREHGTEIYVGATTQSQAYYVFDPCRKILNRSPDLCREFGIEVRAEQILYTDFDPDTGEVDEGNLTPLIGKPGDGADPYCAILDEYHEFKTDEAISAMEQGIVSRTSPLICTITTAGVRIGGPCHEQYLIDEETIRGTRSNDRRFIYIACCDGSVEWYSDDAIKMANPNLGESVNFETIKDIRDKALSSKKKEIAYKTKNLNQFTGALQQWVSTETWASHEHDISESTFLKTENFMAVDLSSYLDTVAITLLGYFEGTDQKCFKTWYFVPEKTVHVTYKYKEWVGLDNFIVTAGERADFLSIEETIQNLAYKYNVKTVAFDPYQGNQMMSQLSSRGIDVVTYTNSVANMSEPMKDIGARLESTDHSVILSRCSITRHQAGQVHVKSDEKDNQFPRKKDKNDAGCRIDGPVSMIMANGLLIACKSSPTEEPEEIKVGIR